MVSNNLDEYRRAIKSKYDLEKEGTNSSYLLLTSRAKLRNLCFELFKDISNQDDLKSFEIFCGFDFNPSVGNKLKGVTDKFRPIETFFKGETVLTDIEALNMAAILVGFDLRPFTKFCKAPNMEVFSISDKHFDEVKKQSNVAHNSIVSSPKLSSRKNSYQVNVTYKYIVIAVLMTLMFSGIGYYILSKESCMQWQGNHYEIVDCEENESFGVLGVSTKMTLNKNMLQFKKIQVSDTTTFFKDKKAIVWYCKNGDQLEFYNCPGFNPENNKPLKPITKYMIDKYVK
ncbi:hypothetical protein H8R23_14095 [Flavobacterium sp. F-380]|uniref:Uncharacterized protein n=1 Tax=Flavobacterium kayseriense TaxID=2764714 RepID=A0ABR7JAY0_9FLAO|nr:hypothetical protein [Flavobacterium kayseriense]MBC5842543.1 hypothetical protein [Flavobacterium kayseriense]MBC5849073.1 hypothetical protein [Flavobacterium kayseriense]